MPHVDEGLLHAYLDGALDALAEAGALPHGTTRQSIEAHVAGCADCRALLEAERSIRTRAGAVLDAAAPVVVVPPFAELFAAQRARRPPRRVWPLAWAASLLLAVGAGWWGNIIFRERGFTMADSDAFDTASPPATDASSESQRAMTPAESRADAATAAEPVVAPAAPPPPVSADARFRDAETAGGAAAGRPERAVANELRDVSPPPALARTGAAEGARAERTDDARRMARADSGRVTQSQALLSAATGVVRESAAVTRQERVAAAPPPPAPPPSAVPQRAAAADFAGAAAAQPNVQDFRRTLAELDAGRIPLANEPMPAGLPSLQLEGGSAQTIQRGAVIGANLARITQRAASGVAVELIVYGQSPIALDELVVTGAQARERDTAAVRRNQRQRAEAEALQQKAAANRAPFAATRVADAALPDGRRELLLRSADGTVFVALRAAVSPAELQSLAGTLVQLPRN